MTGRRAQTEFDYVVGMTLMLLTLSGVFMFVPGIYEPFEDPVDADEAAASERIADNIMNETVVSGTENTINYTRMEAIIQRDFDTIRSRSAVPSGRTVNVTFQNGSGIVRSGSGNAIGTGSNYAVNEEPAAATVRVVRLQNSSNSQCQTVCRLVVRVW